MTERAAEWAELSRRARAEGWTKEIAAEWGRLRAATSGLGTLSLHETEVARINETRPTPDLMSPDERREVVLAYPEVAAWLAWPPLELKQISAWSGYLPPAEVPHGDGYVPNDSPIREQILGTINEALARRAPESLSNKIE